MLFTYVMKLTYTGIQIMCKHLIQDHIWCCEHKEEAVVMCRPWPENCDNCGFIQKVECIGPIHHSVPCSYCVNNLLWMQNEEGKWVQSDVFWAALMGDG